MSNLDFHTSFVVDHTPEEVFAAITNVRGWWSGDIDGPTRSLGDEFTYHYQDLHRSTQQITELIPAKRLVWHITDAVLAFTDDPYEWVGSDVTFDITRNDDRTEVRFQHVGLGPSLECYERCSTAWTFYVSDSLWRLITTGTGQPNDEEIVPISMP